MKFKFNLLLPTFFSITAMATGLKDTGVGKLSCFLKLTCFRSFYSNGGVGSFVSINAMVHDIQPSYVWVVALR